MLANITQHDLWWIILILAILCLAVWFFRHVR